MKKIACFVLFFVVLAISAFAQSGKFTEPAGAELEKFPIMSKPLSVAEQAKLGLSAKKLEKPVVVQNHFRGLRDKSGRFVLETLSIDTLVLVDKDGKLRYKASCGNRLVELIQCPPATTTSGSGATSGIESTTKSNKPGPWQGLTNGIKSAATGLWNFIGGLLAPFGWLLLLLLGLALLVLLAYLLYRLIRWIADAIQNREQGGQEQNPRPDQPPAPVPPARPAPVVPVNPPANPTDSGFPNRRVIVDLGGNGNATRIQAGRDINRIQYERNPTDGSVSIRFFEN